MNTIALMATLQSEPELRFTQDGLAHLSALVSFSAGRPEEADYQIRVIAFGTLAEEGSKTFHHGDAVLIEGRLQAETRNKPDGTKEKVTELIARRLHPAAPSAAAAPRANTAPPSSAPPASSTATTPSKTTQKRATTASSNPSQGQASARPTAPTPPPTASSDDLDDIPF